MAPLNGIPSQPWLPSAPAWTQFLRELCQDHRLQVVESHVRAANQGEPAQHEALGHRSRLRAGPVSLHQAEKAPVFGGWRRSRTAT